VKLVFDLASVSVTEFGVGRDDAGNQPIVVVPADADVQAALIEMAQNTWQAMISEAGAPPEWEPSEKYASIERLQLPLSDELASWARSLHEAANLPTDAAALDTPSNIFCYFARMVDAAGRHLTAVRRSTQFKGVLKSRLLRVLSDSLKFVDEPIFRLDRDFDFLVDSAVVYILHPSGFEFAGKLQGAILDAVPTNIKRIQKDLPFVDLQSIEAYAVAHPRAARLLASIQGQRQSKDINKEKLIELCTRTSVEVTESDGMLAVAAGHELGFLEVLDRRRYQLELVAGQPERFKASSRTRIPQGS
jgi:hypothetical protein